MRWNRTYLFITISSIALLLVLAIQVNWLLQTAEIKENLFNEKANMILARTTDALLADKETSKKIVACGELSTSPGPLTELGEDEADKIDSLLDYYMNFYSFHLDYSFEVIKDQADWTTKIMPGQPACYRKSLNDMVNEKGLELNLILPGKEKFIMAEMGVMFISSVLLILVVLVLSWRTVLSLLKEKRISEHTTGFLNNMTHELKTPLTNIALAGKMITKDSILKQEDKVKHYTGIILEENEKLRLQVEQVLSMTALERGEIPLYKMELNLHELISECLDRMSLQVTNKQGSLGANLDAASFTVIGDKTHLSNALCNLIDNAIKYSNTKPELFVQTSNNGQHIVVMVSDKGIGIEKQYQSKVFDKFFRVPTGDIHNVKGFGLGLAYVKEIIALHGGTIELESGKGEGTTFTITLPNA